MNAASDVSYYRSSEARYFLVRMKQAETAQDATHFRHELSAFLSAGRSVLQYACAEAKQNGRQDWYERSVTRDPCVAFMRDQRDDNVHGRPVAPVTVGTTTSDPDGHATSLTEFYFLEWDGVETAVALGERYMQTLETIVAEGRAAGILSITSPSYNIGDGEERRRTRR